MMNSKIGTLLLVFLWSWHQDAQLQDARYYREQAGAAYNQKNYVQALENLQKALELIPDHPSIIYGIARMQSLLGNQQDALIWLGKITRMGMILHPEKDPDFQGLVTLEGFRGVLKQFEANAGPIVHSSIAFTIAEKGLVTEGIAYDRVEQTFYISSIHKRKIVIRDKQGRMGVLADEKDGLWSVLGMAVDSGRRILWATTTAFPQMSGYDAQMEGKSAVLKFDLKAKKLIKKYPVPGPGNHGLGDLTLNSSGDVLTTDSNTPAVYVIRHDRDDIELLLKDEQFVSPQGLAFSSDQKHLFMADYSKGLFDIDVTTNRARHITPAPDSTSLGIDGLYFCKGNLIGVQNGVTPNRLVRLELSPDYSRMSRFEVLEVNNPLFDEPTLGVVVDDELFFIANSQWGSVDEKGQLSPEEKLKSPLILHLKIGPK
ncbi:MAG TPA: hypothetical protein VKM94_08300 [Blastocatellia bacterium]|nr:hypothetical protein [Blastocatellia bacterium]